MSKRPPSDDDIHLIRLAASCDHEAFCEVIERFDRYVRSVLRRYASRPVDREDLRSEIIEKLLDGDKRALRTWEPRATFGAYLATITARHCMDWLRRRGRLPHARLSSGEDESPEALIEEIIAADDADEPQSVIQTAQKRQSIQRALEKLSSDDRLILYLRFDQDLSGPAIADLLEISPGAARQRLFRAARRLEDQIQETCPEIIQPE